jgi:hypothetical protein
LPYGFLRGKPYGAFYLEANIVTSSSRKGIIKLGGASSQLTTEFDSKENLANWLVLPYG